jgi:hypothetical protein
VFVWAARGMAIPGRHFVARLPQTADRTFSERQHRIQLDAFSVPGPAGCARQAVPSSSRLPCMDPRVL